MVVAEFWLLVAGSLVGLSAILWLVIVLAIVTAPAGYCGQLGRHCELTWEVLANLGIYVFPRGIKPFHSCSGDFPFVFTLHSAFVRFGP